VIATGVAEAGQAAKGIRPAATIVGDCVSLQPGAPGAEPGRADLLDGTGRLVAVLVAGANDVRHLPPGVYFVSRRAADGSGRTATKVVLQR